MIYTKDAQGGTHKSVFVCVLWRLGLLAVFLPITSAVAAPSFEKDIQPIFERRCVSCHGGEKTKGGLNLSTHKDLMEGGFDGQVLIAGKSEESMLIKLIEHRAEPYMPPENAGPPLTADEIKLIRAWIDAGALASTDAPAPVDNQTPPTSAPAAAPPATTTQPTAKMPPQIGALAFSPDGKILAVGSLHVVELLDRANGSVIARLEGHAENVRALTFNKEGTLLAAAGGEPAVKGEVRIWNIAEKKTVAHIQGHNDCIYAVAFSPDNNLLVSCSYDKMIYLWDAVTGKEARSFKNHVDAVYDVAFTPNGKRLASVSADRSVKIWDAENAKHLFNLTESQNALYTVAIHPSGQQVAAAGADRLIRVWNLVENNGKLANSWFAHDKPILRIAYSPDGSRLYSTAQDGSLKVWDTKTLSELRVFEKQPDWNLALSIAPDDAAIAVGRYDGSLTLYDPNTGKILFDKSPISPTVEAKAVLTVATQPAADSESEKDKFAKVGDFIPVEVAAGAVTFPPNIGSLNRRTASPGTTVTVIAHGANLGEVTEVTLRDNGIQTRIVSAEAKPKPALQRRKYNTLAEIADGTIPYVMTLEMVVGFDARPGLHELIMKSPKGVSNGISFYIEDLVEVMEIEPNDEMATAQPITRAAVFLGSMDKNGDVDYFRIDAKAGQSYVFEVVASAIGSGLNSVATLINSDGSVLARSLDFGPGMDAKLAYEFAESGTYYLSLADGEMEASGFYRLRVEDRIAVTDAFPLGVETDKTAEIAIEGAGLGGIKKVPATGLKSPTWGQVVGLPLAGRNGPVLTRLMLAVGEHPEVLEAEPNNDVAHAQPVTAPVTINGRIFADAATDEDVFRFSAKKGQPLILDVTAQRVGSPLDSFIEVLDAQGNRVQRATLRAVAKVALTLFDRDSQQPNFRFDNWDDFRVNDFVLIGAELLRIKAIPDYVDEDVFFFTSRGPRIAYLDTTQEHHAINAPIYKVEVHPPGKTFPPNGNPVFPLYTENDDGGMRNHGKDSCVTFDPPADGEYLAKIRSAALDSNHRYAYRLAIRPPRPDFNVSENPGDLNIPEGSSVPVACMVTRFDGFNGPVHVRLENLPAGCTAGETDVLPDEEVASIIIHADPGATSTTTDSAIRMIATAKIGEETVTRETTIRTIAIARCKPDVELRIEPAVVNLEPGGATPVTIHLQRNNGFAGRVEINMLNLPFGVEVGNTGLNGILITENDKSRMIELLAHPWTPPMDRQFSLTGAPSTTVNHNFTNAAPPALLRIGPKPEKDPRLVKVVPQQ